jgi:hypothetical protein
MHAWPSASGMNISLHRVLSFSTSFHPASVDQLGALRIPRMRVSGAYFSTHTGVKSWNHDCACT